MREILSHHPESESITPPPPFSHEIAAARELFSLLPEGSVVEARPTALDAGGALLSETERNYEIFEPGNINEPLLKETLGKHRLTPDSSVLMLPFGARGRIGWETPGGYILTSPATSREILSREPSW